MKIRAAILVALMILGAVQMVHARTAPMASPGGARLIHPNYNLWVDQLNRAIQLELANTSK